MFTEDEIQLLMDGLDAIEKAKSSESAISMLITGMVTKDKDEARRAMEAEADKYKTQEADRRQMRDRIVLIKARLIQMRDAAVADAAWLATRS